MNNPVPIPELIEGIREICKPVLDIPAGHTVTFPVQWTYHHALERLDRSLVSIHTLVLAGLTTHEHAIGLISRNILTDLLITAHIIRVSTDETIEGNLIPLYYDDLKKMTAYVEMLRGTPFISEREYQEFITKETTEMKIIDGFYRDHPSTAKKPTPIRDIATGAL